MRKPERDESTLLTHGSGMERAADRCGSGLGYRAVKRCMDIVLAIIGGCIFLIPMLAVCIAIVIRDFGSPFYMQKRVGRNGRLFTIVKLRSMCRHADRLQDMLDEEQLRQYRMEFKLEEDPRLIGWSRDANGRRCFGAWLRKLCVDELPQIYWNILIMGNMSVVGPRPILPEELELHYTPEEQERLLSVKPGLTGYWQAYAHSTANYETGERQRMELYYAGRRSVWLDLRILLATVGAVLRKAGT